MTISDKLEELYINTLMQLSELQSFKFSTLKGYDLIETQYAEHMEEIEKQISNSKEKPPISSLKKIALEVAAFQKGIQHLGSSKDSHVNRINKAIIIYACSIFDFFLNETVRLIFLENPNLLTSEKKLIPLYELLINSKEEIIESIVDKYVHELSYKNINERIKYLCDKFQLDISFNNQCEIDTFFSSEINLNVVAEIFAIRNIVIHNQGKINKFFLDSVEKKTYKRDDYIFIDDNLIESLIKSLMVTASSISKQSIMRFY